MPIRDQITKRLEFFDARIAEIRRRADEEIKDLQERRVKLEQARGILTPQIEARLDALEDAGIKIGIA